MNAQAKIHIVDDDPAIRDALCWLFDSRGLATASYVSAESFLAAYRPDADFPLGCLLLDIRMEGMSGLELQDVLAERGMRMPIIFLSGHGDVPVAVHALRQGAVDFLEKPLNDNELVDRVIACLNEEAQRIATQAMQNCTAERLASLTTRQRHHAADAGGQVQQSDRRRTWHQCAYRGGSPRRHFEKNGRQKRRAVELASVIASTKVKPLR